jgi:glycosyltransferase involved in cell wall biosynthesis
VGTGPLRETLEAQARQTAEGRRIHFAGWRANVPEILAAADLVVLPSHWEGMSNVLLEAMAAGKPVVATDVEGVGEVLGRGHTPQMVACNSQVIAEAVFAIASQPEIQSRLGRENRSIMEQDFSLQAVVSRYERLYETLAAE